MWSNYLQHLRGAEVWTAERYTNRQAGATVEVFTDRECKKANTILKKEEKFRRKYFPLNNEDQYYVLTPEGSARTRITKQPV